jgi:hypothetical protein
VAAAVPTRARRELMIFVILLASGGSLVYWCVAFGPYVLVMILRGCWHLMRPADRGSD